MVFFNYIGIESYFRKAIEIMLIIALLCSSSAIASIMENEYLYQNNTNENLFDEKVYISNSGLENDLAAKISSSLVDKIQRSSADEQVSVIVMLKSKGLQNDTLIKKSSDVLSTLESNNGKVGHQYKFINAFSASIPASKVSELARSNDVEKIWFDRILNLPPVQADNRSIKLNIGTNAIGANYIWNATGNTGRGITVAVIDTGIDYNHPDLGGCFGSGCRVKAGYDFVDNNADPLDEYGHGTHVAGIIGANGKVKGVAPDVEFLAAKVCGTMGCPLSAIIAGMDWAAANGADIISMSIGGDTVPNDEFSTPDSIIADSIVDKGIVVVVAAGNEGPGTGTVSSPGTAKKIITVGASNDNGTKKVSDDSIAYFSNRGPSAFGRLDPDVVAPGVAIKSTWLNNTYISLPGTSMATPFVSGSAALLLQHDPSLRPEEVRSKLMTSANNLKKIEYQARDDYSGLWNGPNVELNVTDSVLKRFEISYHIYGGAGCPYYAKTTIYLNGSIIDNKFNYILSSSALNGTFSSSNANGTFKNTFSSNYPYYSTCYSGLVRWKARPDSFVLSGANASVFEQGAGLVNIKNAIMYSTKATINNNDRWETSVEPGFTASSILKIRNNNIYSVNYAFSFEPLQDQEMNNEISLSGFSLPENAGVEPGTNETVKIVFSAPPDAKPSIYGTTLVITGNNSEILRIPIIITVPFIGEGTITGSTNEDASGGFGDWKYYKIKSHNGKSLTAGLDWASGNDDLDLFLFAPNGEIMDGSELKSGTSEEVSLSDMAYDEYWLAVHTDKLESYEKKPYSLIIKYMSGLEVLPSLWQGNVVKNNTEDIIFTIRNNANFKSNLNLSVKRLQKAENNYSTGSMKGGLKTIWKASKNLKNKNISYISANVKWNIYNKDIDMFVGYPGPAPSWIMFQMFPGINIGSNSIPAFGDLDNDKDLDLLIGKFDGKLSYYENTGSRSFPIWAEDSDRFSGIGVWQKSAPCLADIDNDGDLDLTIGNMDGTLTYYENTGTSSSPRWAKDESMFSGIDAGYDSIPEFAEMDDDGDLDLIIGNADGVMKYYENTGSSFSPVWTEDNSMFENIDAGTSSSPSFSDIDNDTDPDLVTGNSAGMLKLYTNSPTKAWYSGKGNNLNNDLVRSFDLSLASSATLNFRTWYEIESSFDNGYVQVSIDGGSTWITLKKYSGSVGPIYESINLDQYAGNPDLLIRFNYSTDSSVILNGWYLDNISLPQIGFVDGVDAGANSWISNSWSKTNIKWIYDSSMFDIDAGSNSAPAFSDLDNDGDQDLVIGRYSGDLLYLMNSKWAITRFSSIHNNTLFGDGIEKIENADIQYYMKKYGDVGILLYSEDPSSVKYNLTVNTAILTPWKAANIDQTDIDLAENEERQVKISINSTTLNADKTYDSIFIVQNSTEDFARVPIRVAVTKPDTIIV